jgi:ribosomal-protein-alanine N-acetyltransferase
MNCSSEPKLRNKGFEYVELAGEKVRLRPTTAEDAKQGFKLIHNNRDILKWLCWNGPRDREELAETYGVRWPREIKDGTKYSFAIEEKDKPGIFVGSVDARIFLYPQQFEAGYWLGVPYWRQGYAPQALALLCYFFFKHLGAAVVTSSAFVGNIASRRVMEKNGFQFEGTLRRQVFKDGRWIDLWRLSLLKEEWEPRNFTPVYERVVPCTTIK